MNTSLELTRQWIPTAMAMLEEEGTGVTLCCWCKGWDSSPTFLLGLEWECSIRQPFGTTRCGAGSRSASERPGKRRLTRIFALCGGVT